MKLSELTPEALRYGFSHGTLGAVGILLLVAATLKSHQLATSPLLTGNPAWFIGVVECEWFVGLWLLSGLARVWVRRTALLLFGGFLCGALYAAIHGEASCGCLGEVSVSPLIILLVDVGVITLLLLIPRSALVHENVSRQIMLRACGVAGVWLVIASVSAAAMISFQTSTLVALGRVLGDGRTVVLEPDGWVGRRFPLIDWLDAGERLGEGCWTVVLRRTGCHRCEQVIDQFELGMLNFPDSAVAIINLDPCDDGERPVRGAAVSTCLPGVYSWVMGTPSQVRLQDGQVVSVGAVSF